MSSENKKVFVIINKYAGTGFQSRMEGKILDACAAAHRECEIQYTRHRGHATELARQAVDAGYLEVFALGGDGTVNETARALVGTSAALGILPRGSGNGLARHLRIPMPLSGALHLIKEGHRVTIDTFLLNGHLSVNVSGVGFDGHIAAMFGHTKKRGLAGYTKLVMREFHRFPEFEVTVQHGGDAQTRTAFLVAFANASQFGNHMRVAPRASLCDQAIDVCWLRKPPLAALPGFLIQMVSGQAHASSLHHTARVTDFSIQTSRPLPFHVDGEPFPEQQQFQVRLNPRSLHVLILPHARPI